MYHSQVYLVKYTENQILGTVYCEPAMFGTASSIPIKGVHLRISGVKEIQIFRHTIYMYNYTYT